MTPQTLAVVLRNQAWSRAKGELEAVICTYYSKGHPEYAQLFEDLADSFEQFVTAIEDSGVLELSS